MERKGEGSVGAMEETKEKAMAQDLKCLAESEQGFSPVTYSIDIIGTHNSLLWGCLSHCRMVSSNPHSPLSCGDQK